MSASPTPGLELRRLTRELGERILVSGDLLKGWDEGRALCRPMGSRSVKGKLVMVN